MPDKPDPNTPSEIEAPIPLEPTDIRKPTTQPPHKAEIESPGLLEDFEPGTDFEADPEVERVVKGIPVDESAQQRSSQTGKTDMNPVPEGEPISDRVAWRFPAALGAILTLIASIFAGVYADNTLWAHVLRTIYWAMLHAATGVGAIVIAALLLGRAVGSFEGAAARMLLVVSLFLVVFSLDIPIPGRIDETMLAAAAYFGGLVASFRLSLRDAAIVGGAHFALALLVGVGSMLTGFIESGAAG